MSVDASALPSVDVIIDGQPVRVESGTTIWEAARELGIAIPVLCHHEKMDPVGVCRMCVVDAGARTLTPSCTRVCEPGMAIETDNVRVRTHREMLTRLLLSESPVRRGLNDDHANPCESVRHTGEPIESLHRNLLHELGQEFELLDSAGEVCDVTLRRLNSFPSDDGPGRPSDESSPVILVDHQACILCDRCIRACDDIQSNEVIGRTGKGLTTRIAFDLDSPMGTSTCVSCGECAAACPTDALRHRVDTLNRESANVPAEQAPTARPLRSVESICPYCGVGCAVTYHAVENSIVTAEGRDSPVNQGRLCVKGRYGWDYTQHPQRLTRPLIRRAESYPKGPLSPEVRSSVAGHHRKPGGIVACEDVLPAFREATWDEALNLIARQLLQIKQEHGSSALAGFGSAKCSNEEAYLFQKLVRAGFGTNNVDHCTRLCHASSVAALMETIGSGAVTNVFADVARASVCLVTGSNTPANHPVAATFIKQAAKRGTKLIVVDVRRHELADFATHFAQLRSGSDVAFYNAVMHVLIREGWIDEDYIATFTTGFDALQDLVLREYAPETVASICGVSVQEIEAIARTIGETTQFEHRDANDKGGMLIFWGMGISQHTHGTDNARCLISLCLLTGNVGKPGTGLHPLRGQNNVQGASDAGLIPMVYPDYQSVADPEVRNKFEKRWGVPLDPRPGLTVVEIISGALNQSIRGMYILGENPFLSDPNANKVRQALSQLDFLAVQDIFLTETAEFADVILPASSFFEKTGTYTNTDRRVQLGQQVLDSPGAARADWRIICEIANRMELPMDYDSPAEVFAEFASLTTNYATLSHANLGPTGKLWPCANPQIGDGTETLFGDGFPTPTRRGSFVPCRYQPADELPDDAYPFVLTTGRVLEHWHTGTMTRRSGPLDAIEPEAFACLHPEDLQQLAIPNGARIRVESRRGEIELSARADDSLDRGVIFIPFHFREASANILTNDALDPDGKIPEFKFCAVRVTLVEPLDSAG